MKKPIIIAITLAILAITSFKANAQTFGGGVPVTGISNVLAQTAPTVFLTNSFYAYNPQRTLIMGNIQTNQTIIWYYAFQVPPSYTLMPGTTNVYISNIQTNVMSGYTTGSTLNTNIPAVSTLIPLPMWMGLNVGAWTNTVTVIP